VAGSTTTPGRSHLYPPPVRARICKPFKEPRNRFSAWRAGTTTLFVVPARQASWAGGIESSESIPGLLKHLQIRALDDEFGYCRDKERHREEDRGRDAEGEEVQKLKALIQLEAIWGI
jgi:hypothetical protein